MKYTIAIVDDHPLFIEGFKSYLSLNEKIQGIKTALDGQQFIDMLSTTYEPNIVFVDILMPILNGIETTEYIKTYYPKVKVIALSSLESIEHVEKMIDAGVDGYLLKESTPQEIDKAIDAVMSNNNYFSNKILLSLSKKTVIEKGGTGRGIHQVPLSSREREVLAMLCKGCGRREIAGKLNISERTIDKHKENILAKTGCRNLIHLVVHSIKNELVMIDSLLWY